MPRRPGGNGSGLPFDAEKPTYTNLTLSVTSRFNARLANYARHYKEETGHEADLGVLVENILAPALDTDTKFADKKRRGVFNQNGNAPSTSTRAPRPEAGAGGGAGATTGAK